MGGHFTFDDDEIVIHAFYRLRKARSANVHRPAVTSRDHAHDNELIALILSKPFNIDLYPCDLDDQRIMDEMFVELDLALDLLPGDIADRLRLDRFSSWYIDKSGRESKYEKELERIIKSWPSHRVKERRIFSLYERYSGMVIFNPNLLQQKYAEPQTTQHISVPIDAEAMDKVADLGMTNDDWDQEAWHIGKFAWDDGIPPFNSEEYRRTFDIMFNKVDVRRRLDNFNTKLRSWMLSEEGIEKEREDTDEQ